MLPEHQIILDLLNQRFNASDLSHITPDIWSAVVSEAGRHRVAPLVYQKIVQANAGSIIPDAVVKKLREKYLANAYRNTVLFHQLDAFLSCLNGENIPVILLKGAHLAEFVYKDIALRPMSDMDILVKEEDLSKTIRIAFDAGYQLMETKISERENTRFGIAPDAKHFKTLCHPESKCILEIHCSIASEVSPFGISPSVLWRNSQPDALNKNPVFLLCPEDLIIHLCLHASYDDLFGYGLGSLYDIAITIKYYDKKIDWRSLWRRSEQWGTNKCLYVSLYFARKWFGANSPNEFFEKFLMDKMVHITEDRIFRASRTVSVDHHFLNRRIRKRVKEKIKNIRQILSPQRDVLTSRFRSPNPSRFLFSNYFLGVFQAFKEILDIAKTALHGETFFAPIKKGDNDILLRKWLTKL